MKSTTLFDRIKLVLERYVTQGNLAILSDVGRSTHYDNVGRMVPDSPLTFSGIEFSIGVQLFLCMFFMSVTHESFREHTPCSWIFFFHHEIVLSKRELLEPKIKKDGPSLTPYIMTPLEI